MALSKTSVEKAYNLLVQVNPRVDAEIQIFDESTPVRFDCVIDYDRKWDGGYEAVFMDVQDISKRQLEIFNAGKSSIPNTEIVDEENGVTRIVFF